MAGLAISFTLMLIWRVLCNERGFAGNRIYLPIACVGAVLIGHVVHTGLGRTPAEPSALAGSLNISMLMQWVLLAMGVLQRDPRYDGPRLRAAMRLLLVGMFLFAGSIYAVTAGAPRMVVMVAPFGGVSLMAGWLVFAWAVARPSEAVAQPVAYRA